MNPAANVPPAVIGTKRLLEMLDKITKGKGTMEDLDKLEELCYYIKANSLCGLGQTAPNPVLSTLKYFRDEYVAHIVDKKCPAGVCKALLELCHRPLTSAKAVLLCARVCPADAICRHREAASCHRYRINASSAAPALKNANSAPS